MSQSLHSNTFKQYWIHFMVKKNRIAKKCVTWFGIKILLCWKIKNALIFLTCAFTKETNNFKLKLNSWKIIQIHAQIQFFFLFQTSFFKKFFIFKTPTDLWKWVKYTKNSFFNMRNYCRPNLLKFRVIIFWLFDVNVFLAPTQFSFPTFSSRLVRRLLFSRDSDRDASGLYVFSVPKRGPFFLRSE